MTKKRSKKKIIIVIVILVIGLATGIAAGLLYHKASESEKTAYATIEFRYDGISNLKNPDGSPFYCGLILSDEILNEFKRETNIQRIKDMETNELRNLFKISPCKGVSVASAGYKLECQSDELSEEERYSAVLEYADYYREWFLGKYYTHENLYSLDSMSGYIADAELFDGYTLLSNRCSSITNYLSSWTNNDRNLSDENKEEIRKLKEKIEALKKVELKNFYANTVQEGRYRNRDISLLTLAYKRFSNMNDYNMQMSCYSIALDCIDLYNSATTDSIMIPSINANNQFYMSRARTGVDKIADSANQYLEWSKGSKTTAVILEGIQEKQRASREESSLGSFDSVYEQIEKIGEELRELDRNIIKDLQPITIEVADAEAD